MFLDQASWSYFLREIFHISQCYEAHRSAATGSLYQCACYSVSKHKSDMNYYRVLRENKINLLPPSKIHSMNMTVL